MPTRRVAVVRVIPTHDPRRSAPQTDDRFVAQSTIPQQDAGPITAPSRDPCAHPHTPVVILSSADRPGSGSPSTSHRRLISRVILRSRSASTSDGTRGSSGVPALPTVPEPSRGRRPRGPRTRPSLRNQQCTAACDHPSLRPISRHDRHSSRRRRTASSRTDCGARISAASAVRVASTGRSGVAGERGCELDAHSRHELRRRSSRQQRLQR